MHSVISNECITPAKKWLINEPRPLYTCVSIKNRSNPDTSRMCTCNDCALQLCLHAFALREGNWASTLHIHDEYILGEGQRGANG